MPQVAFGVGEVEDRAGVGGVALQLASQQAGVPFELVAAAAAVGVVLDHERVEVLLDVGPVGPVGARVLVRDALVAPGPVAPHQVLEAVLGARSVVAQHVRGRRQPGQRGVLAQDMVGVDGEEEVGLAAGVPDVPGAVVAEVDPGFLVEFARDPGECRTDQVLGAVRRAGVGDHPGVD